MVLNNFILKVGKIPQFHEKSRISLPSRASTRWLMINRATDGIYATGSRYLTWILALAVVTGSRRWAVSVADALVRGQTLACLVQDLSWRAHALVASYIQI